jgi:hypothetical protein
MNLSILTSSSCSSSSFWCAFHTTVPLRSRSEVPPGSPQRSQRSRRSQELYFQQLTNTPAKRQRSLNVHNVHPYNHPRQSQKRRSLPSQIAQKRRNPGALVLADPIQRTYKLQFEGGCHIRLSRNSFHSRAWRLDSPPETDCIALLAHF